MAPKRTSLLDKPPPASSSAKESESESGSEYETSSDEESQQTQPPKPTSVVEAAPPKKPAAEKKAPPPTKKADGESGSDDGESESESDSEEVAEETPAKQQPPKSPVPISTLPAKSAPAKAASGSKKRPTETEPKPKPKPEASNKRPKKDSDPASAPAKNKPLFQRVWSNEDEIAILEGMIAYSAKNGVSPNSNLVAFHDYIKKFLKFDVILPQLKSKITRLKKRYNTCVRKEKNGQKPVNPDKPHEAKVFDLLVKVWGGNGGEGSSGINGGLPPKKKKKKINGGLPPKNLKPPASADIVVLDKCLGDAGFPADLLKQGLELVGARKQAEMEDEWRKFRVAELELCARRTQLMGEQTTLILEAVKSSVH